MAKFFVVFLSLLGDLEKKIIGVLFSNFIPSAYNANKLYGLNKDYVEYQPVSLVKSIFIIKELKKLEKENSQISIIDVGSGTGLLIKVLNVFNFRNLVGVEIDYDLYHIARNNFEDEISENRILFLNLDALDLSLDWKSPVYILFNPFGRETLVKFIGKVCIENSQAHIIYINDLHSNVLANDFVKTYSNHLLKISVWKKTDRH